MTIICVDDDRLQPVYYEKYDNKGLYLFYRPGHYDLIYPMQEKQEKMISNRAVNNRRSEISPLFQIILVVLIFCVCGYLGLNKKNGIQPFGKTQIGK